MKAKRIGLMMLTSLILVSCFKNEEVALEADTDVYMIKKMSGETPVYGVAFYAYCNHVMKSGTVTQTGDLGSQVNLGLNPGSIYTLYKEPTENEFYGTLPEESEYRFNVVAENGQTSESSDYLKVKDLGIPTILKAEVGDVEKLLDITWTKITDADGYVVKIVEDNGSYIYSSGALSPETDTLSINLLVGNWTKTMEKGNTYNIEISAFAYEDNANALTAIYNIESISIAQMSITWE